MPSNFLMVQQRRLHCADDIYTGFGKFFSVLGQTKGEKSINLWRMEYSERKAGALSLSPVQTLGK